MSGTTRRRGAKGSYPTVVRVRHGGAEARARAGVSVAPGVRRESGKKESRTDASQARRQVSPERRKKRRAVVLVAVLIALGLIAAVLYRPVTQALDSRRALAQAEDKLAEERARTRELEERKERDLGEDYVEGEARRMGYVKPGEIPLIVLDEKDGEEQNAKGDGGMGLDGEEREEKTVPEEAHP